MKALQIALGKPKTNFHHLTCRQTSHPKPSCSNEPFAVPRSPAFNPVGETVQQGTTRVKVTLKIIDGRVDCAIVERRATS